MIKKKKKRTFPSRNFSIPETAACVANEFVHVVATWALSSLTGDNGRVRAISQLEITGLILIWKSTKQDQVGTKPARRGNQFLIKHVTD